jgi:hypothetical protein
MADAERIAACLRAGTPMTRLCRQYQCSHAAMMKAILSQMSRRQYRSLVKKILAKSGIKTRFAKGHATWNRGKKGIHLSPASEFKNGHVPANAKGVGEITIRSDSCGKKYKWIATPGPTTARHKWIPYGRWLWMPKKGPVPDGYCVVHVDGNTLNDKIDNLKLVDRKGHLELQQVRDPGMIARCRLRSSQASTKRHVARRLARARAAKEAAISKPVTGAWECIGCGNDFDFEPKGICPKCNGFRFARIRRSDVA